MNDDLASRDLLDHPPRSVDLTAVDRAISAFDAKIEAADAEVTATRTLLDKVTKKAADLRQARTDYEHYRDFVVRIRGLPAHEQAVTRAQPGRRRRGGMRNAILDFLADGAERHTDAIRAALTAEGVIDDSDGQRHSLQVTLSRMYTQGELERPRQAVYKLVPAAAAEESAGEEVLDV